MLFKVSGKDIFVIPLLKKAQAPRLSTLGKSTDSKPQQSPKAELPIFLQVDKSTSVIAEQRSKALEPTEVHFDKSIF